MEWDSRDRWGRHVLPNARLLCQYGFRKITVDGLKHTVFAVNPNMEISTKRNIQAPYANTVAAARELAAVFGYKIGFVAGNTIVEDRKGAERAFPYDSVLADDGTIYINLNAKRPYTSIVGTMFWTQLKRDNPKTANEITRAMRRIKNLKPGTEISGEDLVMSLFGRNTSALKGTTDGAKAVVLNPGELIERLSVDPNLARALEHEAPSAARRMVEAIGDALTCTENKSMRATRVLRQAQARVLKAFSEQAETAREMEQGAPVPKAQARQKTPGDMRYMSIRTLTDGTKYVDIDVDQERFDGLTPAEMQKEARQIIKDRFKGQVIGTNNNRAYVKKRSAEEYAYPAKRIDDAVKESKMRASTELDNLMSASVFIKPEADDGRHPEAVNGWRKYFTIFRVNERYWRGVISVMGTRNGWVFHDVTKIEDVTEGISGLPDEKSSAASDGNVSDNSIPRFLAKVNQTPASQVASQPQTAPPKLTESLFRKQYMLGMREGRAEVRDTYKRRDLRDGIKGRVKKINKALLTPRAVRRIHINIRTGNHLAVFIV